MGRLSRDLVVQDAVVPRSTLPDVVEAIGRIAATYQLTVSNVFHAGDGNLHPNISFDGRVPGLKARVDTASAEIMRRASPWEARSPASTAWGSTSCAICR